MLVFKFPRNINYRNRGDPDAEHGNDGQPVSAKLEGDQGEAVCPDQVPEAVGQKDGAELPLLERKNQRVEGHVTIPRGCFLGRPKDML